MYIESRLTESVEAMSDFLTIPKNYITHNPEEKCTNQRSHCYHGNEHQGPNIYFSSIQQKSGLEVWGAAVWFSQSQKVIRSRSSLRPCLVQKLRPLQLHWSSANSLFPFLIFLAISFPFILLWLCSVSLFRFHCPVFLCTLIVFSSSSLYCSCCSCFHQCLSSIQCLLKRSLVSFGNRWMPYWRRWRERQQLGSKT